MLYGVQSCSTTLPLGPKAAGLDACWKVLLVCSYCTTALTGRQETQSMAIRNQTLTLKCNKLNLQRVLRCYSS